MNDQLLVGPLNMVSEYPIFFVLFATGVLLMMAGIFTSIFAPILGLSERVRSHAMNYAALGVGLAFPGGFPILIKIYAGFDVYSLNYAGMILVGIPVAISILCAYSAVSIEKKHKTRFERKEKT